MQAAVYDSGCWGQSAHQSAEVPLALRLTGRVHVQAHQEVLPDALKGQLAARQEQQGDLGEAC